MQTAGKSLQVPCRTEEQLLPQLCSRALPSLQVILPLFMLLSWGTEGQITLKNLLMFWSLETVFTEDEKLSCAIFLLL